MDELKKQEQPRQNQGGNPAEGQGSQGGRRRRRRHKNGNSAPQNDHNQTQNQARQTAQTNQNQGGKQKQGKQGQNNNNNNGGNGQKKKPNAPVQNNQKQPQKQQNNQNGKQKGNNKQDRRDENRKDTYVYTLDGNLYINLTNKCSNACDFCVRNERASYYGNYLWLRNGDPTAEKVMAAANGFGDLSRFNEVVFCGFGEPTYKMAEMLALCDFFHEKGLKTRLNTNGQGNLINKRDIVPDMKGKIDFVNISLNASCYEKYQAICRSQFKEAGFDGMVEFAKLCRRNGIDCRFSIVDCIGEDEVAACRCLADSVKIPLYVRSYITDS